MKKEQINIILFSVLTCLIIGIYGVIFFIYSEYQTETRLGIRNLEKWDKIKIGRSHYEVIGILGQPKARREIPKPYLPDVPCNDSVYYYQMPPNYSLDGVIWFKIIDTTTTVKMVVMGKSPYGINEYKYLLKK
jgi:hypothetical protein